MEWHVGWRNIERREERYKEHKSVKGREEKRRDRDQEERGSNIKNRKESSQRGTGKNTELTERGKRK